MTSTPHQEQHCLGQIKRLTQFLIASGTLNIILVVFICYGLFGNGMLVMRDNLQQRLRPSAAVVAGERNLQQVLRAYQQLSRDQLIAKLEDVTGVQDGLTERDLALAWLVWKHHFNIEQGLIDAPAARQQSLPIRSGEQVLQLTLFPGLTAEQWEMLVQYGKTEQWPLTSEGIFYAMQSGQSSATEAFCLTPEFLMLQRACARANIDVNKQDLLTLSTTCDWNTLKKIIAQLHSAPDEAPGVLLTWLGNSPEEPQVIAVSEPVKKPIATAPVSTVAVARPALPKGKVHVVKSGESLWKIAKSYQVDVAKLKTHNHLHSDILRPGASLCIP